MEIFEGVVPSKGTEAFERMKKTFDNRVQTPEVKKFYKDCFNKARNSLESQYLSHCNLITETTLRHFLLEFNSRAWEHGLRSMPTLFNIMESFFRYRKPHIYFELLEEENYLISFFDFLDFVTSQEFTSSDSLMADYIEKDIIYNFNVGADLEEIKFQNSESAEFIISGVSIIRREQEVTIVLITGSNIKKTAKNLDFSINNLNPNKKELINKFNTEHKNREFEPEFIDRDKKFAKVILACRVDLDTNTMDARYVAEEFDHMFNINTDEIDHITDSSGEFLSNSLKDHHDHSIKIVDSYAAIFEVAKYSLYLPYFLSYYESKLIEEAHDTEFKKSACNSIQRRKFRDTFGYKAAVKPLFILNVNNKFSPDNLSIREDLFIIETSGYWKKLDTDEVGLNKKGEPIHGKTWVNKKISWFEGNNDDLIIKKGNTEFSEKNAGFIYIVRNPLMGENIFKIGLTTKTVEERAKQLSNTSVPDKFYKVQEWNVRDCYKAEKIIHEKLDDYRIDPRREFFEIDYSVAIETISKVCTEINNNNA